MHELPESLVLARQLNETILGRHIATVVAAASPHKFCWYHGDAAEYPAMLEGRSFEKATAFGSNVELDAGPIRLGFSEGAALRYLKPGDKRPQKHQLLVEFGDGSALVATIQMYGGIYCYEEGTMANSYYIGAKEALAPFDTAFDYTSFRALVPEIPKSMSVKAFLATEQRIPGLGNGVLQDILFNAGLHPKRKIVTFEEADYQRLFCSLKDTLQAMLDQGGRDVEKDIFGQPGGYRTILSAKTVGQPCLQCGREIVREAFLGGNIYYCPQCQPLP